LTAGVLDSDQFPGLSPHLWVIFHGIYDTKGAADAELQKVQAANPQAFVREVK